MRIYIDTGVALAYIIVNDPNHEKAKSLIDTMHGKEFVLSELNIVEMFSVISRNIEFIEIPGVEKTKVDLFEFLVAVILFVIESLNAKVYSISTRQEILNLRKSALKLNNIFIDALELAPKLKLKTLDLLHLIYAEKLGAQVFLTLDKNIMKKHREIRDAIGIEVIPRDMADF